MQVRVILTGPEQHPVSEMPRALRHALYHNDDLLSLIDWNGCPNSGCEHRLGITGERVEVIAWLDLFLERYPKTEPEINEIKNLIRQRFLSNPNRNTAVNLRDIKRFVEYNGETVERLWFWTEGWEDA